MGSPPSAGRFCGERGDFGVEILDGRVGWVLGSAVVALISQVLNFRAGGGVEVLAEAGGDGSFGGV